MATKNETEQQETETFCEYCKIVKAIKEIKLSSIDGSVRKINLCEECVLQKDTEGFFYTFHKAD